MKIVSKEDSISIKKPDGTNVSYLIFPEYEIHISSLSPEAVQPWHHHKLIEEVICIKSGKMKVNWLEDNKKFSQIVQKNDIVRVENTPHNFENPFEKRCNFFVIRFIHDHKDNRELIKNDKYLD